jgi:hypothetical protein
MLNLKKLVLIFTISFFSLNLFAKKHEIVKAIERGDLNGVIEQVELGADLEMLIRHPGERFTETLLHRALYEMQPEILTFLIETFKEKGISIDKTGSGKMPVLMEACFKGMPDYVEILIDSGADVNFSAGKGITPFVCAILASGPKEDLLATCEHLKASGANLRLSYFDLERLLINYDYYKDHENYQAKLSFLRKNANIMTKIKYFLVKTMNFFDLLPYDLDVFLSYGS